MNPVEVTNPYTLEVLQKISRTSFDLVQNFVESNQQRNTQLPLHPLTDRISWLEKFRVWMMAHTDEIIRQAILEGGKPLKDTRVEFKRALQGVTLTIEGLTHLQGREIPMGLSEASQNLKATTHRFPIGTVLAISAFNHPINLFIHQVLPAIAVGAPILYKPSEKTPLTSRLLIEGLYQSGVPEDLLQYCLIDHEQLKILIQDSRIKYVSFIGASHVGWDLRKQMAAGQRFSLEHGGSAPAIVCEDADLSKAIPQLVKSSFAHAGQVCISTQRIFVHEKIEGDFVDEFIRQTRQLKVGDPLNEEVDMGPLIRASELTRVEQWIKEALAKRATVLCGGRKISESLYEPTVIVKTTKASKIYSHEVFGPVVNILSYSDLHEAIARANELPMAFQSSIYTESATSINTAFQKFRATTVLVNQPTTFRVDWMPFAGLDESGFSIGGLWDTLREYTYEKMLVSPL